MNKTLIVQMFAALMFMACVIGCASTPKLDVIDNSATTSIRIYEVFGMDCPGCHGGVEKLVLDILGVTNAKASWVEKSLTLTIKPGSDLVGKVWEVWKVEEAF